MKRGLTLLLFLLFALNSFAQDKIYLKLQKTPLEVFVVAIGTHEIKYRALDASYIIAMVAKKDVAKIVFKSGRTQTFSNSPETNNVTRQYLIKAGLLSPLFGTSDLYLEKPLKRNRSVEYQVKIIGLGRSMNYPSNNQMYYGQPKGASLGIGMKFFKSPKYPIIDPLGSSNPLEGYYIKPSFNIMYCRYDQMSVNRSINTAYHENQAAVISSNVSVELGKQWRLGNNFSLEIYGQLGWGMDYTNSRPISKYNNPNSSGLSYSSDSNSGYPNLGAPQFSDGGLIMGAGLKVGYLLNWKKKLIEKSNSSNK
jgi:hypothetical protein